MLPSLHKQLEGAAAAAAAAGGGRGRCRQRAAATARSPQLSQVLALLLQLLLLASSSCVTPCGAARPMPMYTAAATGALPQPPRQPSELSNTFIITTLEDLEPQLIDGAQQTPCAYAVARARSIGGRHFSLAVTGYWLGSPTAISSFAYKSYNESAGGLRYLEPTPGTIRRWKRGLQSCFRAAISAGFDGVQILNHIDQADHSPTWRNLLAFDPTQAYGGHSYEDVVVRPAADALRTATRPSTQVWFIISGEMGRSIFAFPAQHAALVAKYQQRLGRGGRAAGGNVKVGLALHWNKVCGACFDVPNDGTAAGFNASYAQAFAASKDELAVAFNFSAIASLFESVDVLGISHYAPMPQQMSAASFELPFSTCAFELSLFGIDLRRLMQSNARDLLFSEVGLGGAGPDHKSAAPDLASLVENVERGIWAVYSAQQDPWRRPEFRDYRRTWFSNLVAFLRSGGLPALKVDGAFIWSVGSFDAAAVHPISTSAEGSYGDDQVVAWMRELSSAAAAPLTA